MLGGSVNTGPTRIYELDALRGLAALVVFVHHVFVIFNEEVRAVVTGVAFAALDLVQAQNKGAVLTFFVLSGYAIGLATCKRPPVTRKSIADYANRRARRILPLYWFSLVFTALLGLVYARGEPSFSLETFIGNIFFLQTSASAKGNWFEPFGLNGPYWSLSYEAFFYALLPAALLLVRWRPFSAHPKTALIGLGIFASFAAFAIQNVAPSPFSSFLTLWVVWIVGYVAVDLEPGFRSAALVTAPALLTGTAVAVLALLGLQSDTLFSILQGTVIAGTFALVALFPGWTRSQPMRLLRGAFVFLFRRIGEGSYTLYLLHYPLLLALHQIDAPLASGIYWAGVSLGLALFVIVVCPWIEAAVQRFASPSYARQSVDGDTPQLFNR